MLMLKGLSSDLVGRVVLLDSAMEHDRCSHAVMEFFHEPSKPLDGDQVRNAWSRSRDHASLSSSVRWKSDALAVSTKRRGSRFTVPVRSRSRGESTASHLISEDRDEPLIKPR